MSCQGIVGVALVALLAAVAAEGAAPPPEKVVLAPSTLELPVKIGPLHYSGEPHRYEPAAAGVSYAFAGRGLLLTVYVYDGGLQDLPDGGDTVEACEQVEMAKEGVKEAKYPNTVLTREQFVRLTPSEAFPLAHEVRYELEREGRPSISYIWVTAAAKHFIKLRFSFDKELKDEEVDARRGILDAVGDAVRPWLAVVQPEPEKDPGTTINVAMGSEGDVTATMLYTTMLSSVLEQSPELAPPCGGTVVPSFETEVGVLRGVLQMAAAGVDSSFTKRLARIEKAGFLEEFVWSDMHREEWGAWEPSDLASADYLKWKKKHLKNFRVPNLGSVTVSHPRKWPVEGAEPTATPTP
ncbi:MAG TPA: hypothetical protein VFV88_08965 [Steroidobacteraceae bacterium]|nr:hypothetical protein [Steroidobacteraceae bacterium]